MNPFAHDPAFSVNRRAFLRSSVASLGGLALAHLSALDAGAVGVPSAASPLAPKRPHFKPRAKSVICLFQGIAQ